MLDGWCRYGISLVVTVRFVDFFLVFGEDAFPVDFLGGGYQTLCWLVSLGTIVYWILTFCAVHSSSARAIPSMISMPAKPPCLPAAWSSFKTIPCNFSLWQRSSRPWPSIPCCWARFFSAGSAGTIMATGLALSDAAYTQILPTTVAER